jgi:hypothetical protein
VVLRRSTPRPNEGVGECQALPARTHLCRARDAPNRADMWR